MYSVAIERMHFYDLISSIHREDFMYTFDVPEILWEAGFDLLVWLVIIFGGGMPFLFQV